MADVYTVLFILLGILLTLPALLVALNLLLPGVTQRTQTRLAATPGKSFFLGVPVASAFILFVAITTQVNFGLIKAVGGIAAIVGMGIGTIGAAGMARLLADRLRPIARPNSELTHLIRGAVVYELACLFPIVGWFLFIPFASITVLGAAVFALLKWVPRPRIFTHQTTTVANNPVVNNPVVNNPVVNNPVAHVEVNR